MTKEPERKPADLTFGIRLRAARKRAGLSLEELSTQIGGIVTKQALSKYEKGRMMPSPEILRLLEEALDIRSAEEGLLMEVMEGADFLESPPAAKSVVEIRDEVHYLKSLDTESAAKIHRSRMRIGSDLPAFLKKMKSPLFFTRLALHHIPLQVLGHGFGVMGNRIVHIRFVRVVKTVFAVSRGHMTFPFLSIFQNFKCGAL